MIYFIDDFDDQDEDDAETARREAHLYDMDRSSASGGWWRPGGRDLDDLDRAPDSLTIHRRKREMSDDCDRKIPS